MLGVTANLKSRYGDAEDNAAMMVGFPSALSILEASWTTVHNGGAPGLALYGTKGTIVVEGGDILIYRETGSKTPSQVEKGEAFAARPINDRRGDPAPSRDGRDAAPTARPADQPRDDGDPRRRNPLGPIRKSGTG